MKIKHDNSYFLYDDRNTTILEMFIMFLVFSVCLVAGGWGTIVGYVSIFASLIFIFLIIDQYLSLIKWDEENYKNKSKASEENEEYKDWLKNA